MKMSAREREFHRKAGAKCFNEAWDLLDKKNRTHDEDILMLHLAHASRYHWSLVGTPTNRAVGDWQISRIYVALGQPGLALEFAKECMRACKKGGLSEIEHTADEAMARAYGAGMDHAKARRHLNEARRKLDRLSLDKEDRAIYLAQLKETESMIKKRAG
jgi:hypothetical protein